MASLLRPLTRLSLPAFLCFVGLSLSSCQNPTLLKITLRGDVLQNPPNILLLLNLQFFQPGGGQPFDRLTIGADQQEGFQEGEVVDVSFNVSFGTVRDLEIAGAIVDLNGDIIGSGRVPFTLRAGNTAEVFLDLGPVGCGDGFVQEETEECDDAGAPDGCPDNCSFGVCGNGVIDASTEECDFGPENGLLGSGCDLSCRLSAGLVFGGRAVAVDAAPRVPFVIPSGLQGAPEVAVIDLEGHARLLAPTFDLLSPLAQPSPPLSASLGIDALDAADLTGDGIPEIFALDRLSAELLIFPREGSGFGAPEILPLSDPVSGAPLAVESFALFPVSGAAPILLLAAEEELIAVPFLEGVGYDLQSASRTALGAPLSRLLVGEFSGDSLPDLAAVAGGSVLLLEGTETGPGTEALRQFSCDEDGATSPLVDLDALSFPGGGASAPLALRADGRLCVFRKGEPDEEARFFVSSAAQSAAVLTSPTRRRVVVARADTPAGVLFDLDGVAAPETLIPVDLGPTSGFLAALDLDGDDGDDLIAATPKRQEISLYLGDAQGRLSLPSAREEVSPPKAMATADLDGDGRLDLSILTEDAVEILLSPGAILDTPQSVLGLSGGAALRVLDRNLDLVPDLAVPVPESGAITILLGDGEGAFPETEELTLGGNFGPLDLSVGNFDATPGLDFAVVYDDLSGPSSGDGGLLLYSGVSGALPTPREINLGALGASRIEGRDLNADLLREAIVPLSVGNGFTFVTHRSGAPESVFLSEEEDCAPLAALPLSASEDGLDDVILFCREGGDIVVYNNPGASTPPIPLRGALVDGDASAAAVGDLNGDERADVIGAGQDGRLAIALGRGDGTFSEPFSFPASLHLSALLVVDLDRDGKAEILFADALGRLLGVWGRGL